MTGRTLPGRALGYRPEPEAVSAPAGDDPLRKKAPDSTTKAEFLSAVCRAAALIR